MRGPCLPLSVNGLLGALLVVLACGCPEDPSGDADLGPSDGLADRMPDSPVPDLGVDIADAATDAFYDQMQQDIVLTDTAPSQATILYTPAVQTGSFGIRTTSTVASNPTPMAGWTGYVDLDPLKLTGIQEALPVTRTVPQEMAELDSNFQGIRLPNGLGSLYYFHHKLKGTSGLLRVEPGSGTLQVILEVPGAYEDTLGEQIGLTADGTFGAALEGKKSVLLFHTDGITFPNGKTWTTLALPATPTIDEIWDSSLTIVPGWIYCTGKNSDGDELLLRAPLDGTKPLEQVPLPKSSDDKAIKTMSSQPAVSADGSLLVLPAGADPESSNRDLYAVLTSGLASSAATRVTAFATQISERGLKLGDLASQIAVSPKGTLVAYVSFNELFVAKTDGKSPPVQVSDDSRFDNAVPQICNLIFIDEGQLIFMAGAEADQMDLYHWDHAKEQATNITGYGSTAQPFNGKGTFRPRAIWSSPNGQFLYWIEQHTKTGFSELRGLELSTLKLLQITNGVEVQHGPGSAVACHKSGQLYFVAEPDPKKNNREIWVFDQDKGTKALKLTTMSTTPTTTWYVYNLVLGGDCSHLAWTAGSQWLRTLWVLDTSKGPGTAQKITQIPLYIPQSFSFTPDQTTLVYGSGTSDDNCTLKAVPIPPGAPVTLDNTAGYVHIFDVF